MRQLDFQERRDSSYIYILFVIGVYFQNGRVDISVCLAGRGSGKLRQLDFQERWDSSCIVGYIGIYFQNGREDISCVLQVGGQENCKAVR